MTSEHQPRNGESSCGTATKNMQRKSQLPPVDQGPDQSPDQSMSADQNDVQFKIGDDVQFKFEKQNKKESWIPAIVSFVGNKHIKVQHGSNKQPQENIVQQDQYRDKIRINEAEKAQDEDADIQMEDKKEYKKEEIKQNDDWSLSGFVNASINAVIGSPKKSAVKVKAPTFDEKAIIEWSRNDVISWMKSKSMSSYAQYADNVPKHMDGKELLDTTIDDLTLIIPKKLWRRRFMQQVELAKKKYVATQNNEQDDDDHKEKEKAINGIVGLNNLGATCYMNTSIQILSQSPYITRYLKKRAKMTSNASKAGRYPMLNAWTDLCDIIYNKKARSRNVKVVNPAAIRDALKDIDPEFGSGAQDDSSRSLGYMLQALDEEIDQEIKNQKKKKKGKKDTEYKDNISIYHGRELNDVERNNAIEELLQDHNPFNSIVRKAFDGIEHVIYECLECNHKFQQFATFRIIDLTLVSHKIKVKNIHVVCGDKYYHIPEISMLDYCAMDLLQYYAAQYLAENTNETITNYDCNIVILSAGGKVNDVHNRKLSEIQDLNGVLFVLINKNAASPNELGRILQVDLAETANKSDDIPRILSIKYNKYDANQIRKLARDQITACHQQLRNGDKKQHDYYLNYNGNVFSVKELKHVSFEQHMHNIDGINVLFVLRVSSKKSKYSYDINDYSLKIGLDAEAWCAEASRQSSCSSTLNALNKYKSMKMKRKQKYSKREDYHTFEHEVESELNQINKTIQALQAKQDIVDITNNFVHLCDVFSSTTYRLLTDLSDCLVEYQNPKILDATCYGFRCSNCKSQSNSLWVKVQKQIVHSPPIFLFHLDRYGKNMTVRHTKSHTNLYQIGQILMVNWGQKPYQARILNVSAKGMQVEYLMDKEQEWIPKWQYFKKLTSHSGRDKYNNASNKFEHSVRYEMELKSANGVYDLYGISNHSGTTSGGHYTVTIRCLTDEKWYDISDSHVSSRRSQPLSHSESATILAYVKK